MSIDLIRKELETKLKTWADSQSPAITVAWQDVSFTKPVDYSPFVEPILMPTTTMNYELSGHRRTEIGLFQINVWTKKGIGMSKAESIATSLVTLYPIVPKTGTVSIESTPSLGRSLSDDSGWVITPVLISYRYENVA